MVQHVVDEYVIPGDAIREHPPAAIAFSFVRVWVALKHSYPTLTSNVVGKIMDGF